MAVFFRASCVTTSLLVAFVAAFQALSVPSFGAAQTRAASGGLAPLPATPVQTPDFDHMDAADLRHYATELLTHGLEFDQAIDLLQRAVTQVPTDPETQLALGCACADRFASVVQAARLATDFDPRQQSYRERRLKWEQAQSDASAPQYGIPPPVPPAAPATPDDRHPFTLSQQAAARLLTTLGRRSVDAFAAAHRLAQDLPPERRGAVEFTRGWGLSLLRWYGKDVVAEQPVAKDADDHFFLPAAAVTACFRQATADAPQRPEYWQSLGLSSVPQIFNPEAGNGGSGYLAYLNALAGHPDAAPDPQTAAALDAFQRALALQPRSFDLLYQFSVIAAPSRPAEAAASLEKAAPRSGNAVVWYLLAAAYFGQAQAAGANGAALEEKAVAAVQSGNGAPAYASVSLSLPVPPELKPAWAYRPVYGAAADGLVVQDLDMALEDRISTRLAQRPDAQILSDVQTLMGLGLKVVGNYSVSNLDAGDPHASSLRQARLVMGIVGCSKACGLVKRAQADAPDDVKARYILQCVGTMQSLDQLLKGT